MSLTRRGFMGLCAAVAAVAAVLCVSALRNPARLVKPGSPGIVSLLLGFKGRKVNPAHYQLGRQLSQAEGDEFFGQFAGKDKGIARKWYSGQYDWTWGKIVDYQEVGSHAQGDWKRVRLYYTTKGKESLYWKLYGGVA